MQASVKERFADAPTEAIEQLRAGSGAAIEVIRLAVLDAPNELTENEIEGVVEKAWAAAEDAARVVAEQQQAARREARLGRRGRPSAASAPSIMDGWLWRRGRPSASSAEWLLFLVEGKREGRSVSRAVALAEALDDEAKRNSSRRYRQIQYRVGVYRERGFSQSRALVAAVKDVVGSRRFRSLEVRFSQVLSGPAKRK